MCNIKNQLAEFIKTEILDDDNTDVLNEDNLLLNNVIDSLGVMRLVTYIQDAFQIKVPPQDMTLENFQNLDLLSSYLQKQNT